jgi:hypothetical protein
MRQVSLKCCPSKRFARCVTSALGGKIPACGRAKLLFVILLMVSNPYKPVRRSSTDDLHAKLKADY